MPDIVTIVRLPKMHENMDEATIGPWLKQVGQAVDAGDCLVELITPKNVIELEAPAAGILLQVYAAEKSTVPIGYALAALGPAGSVIPDVAAENDALQLAHATAAITGVSVSRAAAATTATTSTATAAASTDSSAKTRSVRAAPAARALARQHDLDLTAVAEAMGVDIVHRQHVEEVLQRRQQNKPQVIRYHGDLSGKVALVTGAGGGIGQAIAKALGSAGATLALHYHRSGANIEALAENLRDNGVKLKLFQADLSKPDQAGSLVQAVNDSLGGLHILVNNAGMLADSVVSFMSDEQWRQVMAINLDAPFYLCRAAAMLMARQRFGRIINITSDAGRLGAAGRSNYAAAKEGLVGFTRSLARELAGSGIRVNAVSPGFVETAMVADLNENKRREILKMIPVRRFGEAAEVADLVLFLTLPCADYITGQVISIDGGLFMG